LKLLLVRLDGIGDALVCTPLIAALRDAGHELGLALSDRNAAVFAPRTAQTVHVLERIPWPRHGSTPLSRALAGAEIAAQRYDAALIASEEPEAYELARGIPQRVGFVTGWAKPFKTWWARRRLTTALVRAASAARERAHEVEVLFRLGRDFAGGREPGRAALALRPWIVEGPVPQRAEIVVQLGTKWLANGVGADALRRMTRTLRERGARFVVAPAERAAVAAQLPELVLDAPAGVRAWIAYIDAAATVVTVDTGAAHLAGMLGIPVVDVFPDAGFDDLTRRWRPWASSSIVLRASGVAAAPETLIAQALDAV
jgi:ADP-heptose:LPS heptosyltransferase